MSMFKMEIDYDKIKIEGALVTKPAFISAGDWVSFWETVASWDMTEEENLETQLTRARSEADDLREQVCALQDKVDSLLAEKSRG